MFIKQIYKETAVMLSYVNKIHMLIVRLGRKERLNNLKFYFVHHNLGAGEKCMF